MAQLISLPSLRVHYREYGQQSDSRPAVVLLHGWPQTSACWEDLLPHLDDHRVIAPDLRGYGLSDRPTEGYTKKRMAADLVELLDALELDQVHLVGHDRGARVAHRFALDYPQRLRTLSVLDIVPTHAMFSADMRAAAGFFHWLFHMQDDLPETLTQGREAEYLRYFFHRWTLRRDRLEPRIPKYIRSFTQPGAMRSGFDDYRATWQDVEDDDADQHHGNLVSVPTLALWGDHGLPAGAPVLEKWRSYVAEGTLLRGGPIPDCGHFIPEERPEELAAELLNFWGRKAAG